MRTSSISARSHCQLRGFAARGTESYKKTIKELTTKVDNVKVDDDGKSRDDTLENLCQYLKNFQRSMEYQAATIINVKADASCKIGLLQSELASVQAELSLVKTVAGARERMICQPGCEGSPEGPDPLKCHSADRGCRDGRR
ncbi:hypothetical protein J3R83DRAFT_154 [Lanmaoa asiatica]|nr:hypothetical protein J3R83DRAFT_154 [Lanmaoa asiatica]